MSPQAIAHYEQSADYYKGEESNRYRGPTPPAVWSPQGPYEQHPQAPSLSAPHSSANKCLLKVAGYAAQLEQYQKAIDIYEQVGTEGRHALLLQRSLHPLLCAAAPPPTRHPLSPFPPLPFHFPVIPWLWPWTQPSQQFLSP